MCEKSTTKIELKLKLNFYMSFDELRANAKVLL